MWAAAMVEDAGTIPITEALVVLSVLCLVFYVIVSSREKIPQGLKKLPGPRGYPFIGNILQLGKKPHVKLTQMRQKYGDVMKIHIGTRPVVVISGLDTIKQALVKQGEGFMGRPDLYSFRHIADGQSLTFGRDSKEVCQARRKLVQNALKTFASSTSPTSSLSCLLEEHISNEAESLVMELQQVMEEKESFDPYGYLGVSVANVICAICFGQRYRHDDQELLNIVNFFEDFEEVAAVGSPADFIPLLRYLPNPAMKKFKELNTRLLAFLQKYVKEHYESFDKENIRDITDALIMQSQGKKFATNARVQLPEEKIINLVNDVLGASFDTMTTALSWCLMYLVAYPEVQKKIQEDLDRTIGSERMPRLSDQPLLPYLEAFILEVLRHSSFVPFTIPHCTTRETALNGFYIPKDICVFINQWQVNHDAKLWKDPSSFLPERFLLADGTKISRADGEKVMAFGLGKRRCIGESIARSELFLFLAILLHRLEFCVRDGEKVDLTPCHGLAMKHKRCYVQVRPRLPKKSSD
ncbi:PREDICTED: cytochrome P450 1A5-like [Gekko japonicus]|uniref:Cytochrome P450 1A n=1 Tax=Gekko japonicus TaxID=146911 RepID=A0ABM1KE69_GEKJA|nr:PREDICTED: cytochrome P450 1A5-like [Gekko japonicus]